MREILFRGKRVDNGEWIEGSLINTTAVQTKYFIIDSCWCESQRVTENGCADFNWLEAYEVIPETIGQYTGLVDKKDEMVFEGDIVKISGDLAGVYVSVWEEYNFEYEFDNKEMSFGLCCVHSDDIEVIGNIHDNPELISN